MVHVDTQTHTHTHVHTHTHTHTHLGPWTLDALPYSGYADTHTHTVKSRQSAPTSSSTLQVGRGGWASPTCRIQCYMKKYSPYENCSCSSYTDQRSRARSRTDPTKRRVCAIPGQEGGHCCVHFQRGRARVCGAVRHHRLRQSYTRIQSITSLTRSQGGADHVEEMGRTGRILRTHIPKQLLMKVLETTIVASGDVFLDDLD